MNSSKKIHILLVIRWPVGGIRTFCNYVYQNFSPEKYQLTILAPDLNETLQLKEDLKQFNPHLIPFTRSGAPLYKINDIRLPLKFLRNKNIDLIHSQGITAGIIMAIPAFLFRIPHILTIHETISEEHMEGYRGFLKRIICSLTLSMINIIHHVSCDAKENILNSFPVLKKFKKKNIVIHHGINVQNFLSAKVRDFRKEILLPDNSFLIGFLGRFMPEKGFVYLIEAMDKLAINNSLNRTPIVMVFGWGAFIREYQEIISQKGLNKYFNFLPFTPDVASALKGLDVIVIPSLREACGLVAMEAMVSGLPVIGTDCIGLRETLENTPAITIPPKESLALSEALIQEMHTPTKENAKRFVNTASKNFDVIEKAHEVERYIQILLKK